MILRPAAGTVAATGITVFVLTTLICFVMLNLTLGNKQIDDPIVTDYSVADSQFQRAMSVLGPALIEGNRVQALQNGDEIFPAMLEAIRGAQHSITFETYIFWSGTIGKEFAAALGERARAGVPVKVLLDWWGSDGIEDLHLESIRKAGAEVRRYNPPRLAALGRMNNRTHRKLLIVDGRIGFTGGVGIADLWRGDAQDPRHWRDTHFRAQGPVVRQMQAAFLDNWVSVTGRVLAGSAYLPPLEPEGPYSAQAFTSSPGGGAESVQLMYLLSIAAARRSVRLSMAYFVPDNVAIKALLSARQRGVRVQIVVPGTHADRAIVRRASRSEWGPLLRAGVEIYEYQPTMFHCKVMIVDELWTSVGSTNFDPRSFSVNDETNLNVYAAGFAQDQVEIFERDLQKSRLVTLADWESRRWGDKVLDALAGMLSSQL